MLLILVMATNQQSEDQLGDNPPTDDGKYNSQSAADLIRHKVSKIYEEEPSAKVEISEVDNIEHRSKHQKFMFELSNSGKDLAEIQTEWHNYYQNLPANEKHQVWQEFYESQSAITGKSLGNIDQGTNEPNQLSQSSYRDKPPKPLDSRTTSDIKQTIKHKVSAGGKLKTKHHIQSLLFGLGIGLIAVLIFLFGFFNEVVIAPFIQPSRTISATPLIVSSSSVAASATPEVIIPKINVEIPVDYNQTSTNESVIENALESGVVHYPNTSVPGQNGNAAFFGHSSNNIFNKGKYKFAFVLLHTLVPGDTFYLTYNSKVYVYKVISKTVVDPSDVSVLGPVEGQVATATLITCDPPGTSLHRLIIVGQQVNPDPVTNTAASTDATISNGPSSLPGNGPTLFGKFVGTFIGKAILVSLLIFAFVMLFRWVDAPRRKAKKR
jgi:sortase A